MEALVLLGIATAPCVAIGLYIYLNDKHEREPIGLLLRAYLYGVLSIGITYVISKQINRFITIDEKDLTEQAIHAFLIVALVEETSKFIFVRGILYNNVNFNEPFDGIVYSVMVGMGFATFENVLYVLNEGFSVGVLRMFTAVPAHACFAVLMGFYLGKAKFDHKKGYYAFYALGVATLFHGAYDYCLFVSWMPGIWIGTIVALAVAIALSKKAILIHQIASPFQVRYEEESLKPVESVEPPEK
ncbi:MAG TPA: PrsW family glutamic-type intramembrane protease [Cyclobacteriaceae bacterium]|nr:PrsW family glutamic-type intramembrane protease [Cyclobacteriaceae bacterium]